MPYAIQIIDGENCTIYIEPGTDRVQRARAKYLKEGLVELDDDSIWLTDAGRILCSKAQ